MVGSAVVASVVVTSVGFSVTSSVADIVCSTVVSEILFVVFSTLPLKYSTIKTTRKQTTAVRAIDSMTVEILIVLGFFSIVGN